MYPHILLPDDMYIEIINHLPPSNVIGFKRVAKRFRLLVDKTMWSHTVRDVGYLAYGYKFMNYHIEIKPRHEYKSMNKVMYNRIFANLNVNCEVTLKRMIVTPELLRKLSVVGKLKLSKCSCWGLLKEDYQLFAAIKSISFSRCREINISALEGIEINKFRSDTFRGDSEIYVNGRKVPINHTISVYTINAKKIDTRHRQNWDTTGNFQSNVIGLSFRRCQSFPDNFLRSICHIRKLTLLQCNEIDDDILQQFVNLENLAFSGSVITGRCFRTMTNLKKLRLSGCCNIVDESFKYLQNIRKIDIGACENITNCGFSNLVNVKNISLDGSRKITADIFNHLSKIEFLCMISTKIKFAGLNFDILSKIKRLRLYQVGQIDFAIFRKLDQLIELNLSDCKQVVCDELKYLGNINKLKLSNCNNLVDDGLKYLTNVRRLDLSRCTTITDEGLQYLTRVIELDLSGNFNVTNQGLSYLVKVQNLKIKKIFNGCSNKNITDDGLIYLSNVTKLDLTNCVRVTESALQTLPNIVKLTVYVRNNIYDCNLLHKYFVRR